MPYAGFGTSTSLSQAEIAAIELAVKVTGQQAIADLQARLQGVNQDIDFNKQALAGGAQTHKEFEEAVKKLVAQQTKLADAVKAAENAHKNVSNQFSNTGQAALQLSYAIDDLQYGFQAIVNNAPQIALAMGGGPGLAGALGVAFVAANVLVPQLKDLGGSFKELARGWDLMRDPARDATTSLEGYQEIVKAITDKPFKVEVDYVSIRQLTREIEVATKAAREFDAMNDARTQAQAAAQKAMTGGIVESGGGKHGFEDAMIEIAKRKGTYGAGSEIPGQIAGEEQWLANYQAAMKTAQLVEPVGGPMQIAIEQQIKGSQAKIVALRDKMDTEARQEVKELAELRRGDASARVIAEAAADEANAAIFARHGIDPLRLRAGAEGATFAEVQRVERRKVEEAQAKKEAKALEDKNRLEQEATRNAEQARKHLEATDPNITGRSRDAALNAQIQMSEEHVRQKTQDFNQDQREKAKDEREATAERNRGIAARQREMRQATAGPANWGMYAQEFQDRTGANNARSITAGKQVGAMVEKGEDPEAAMQQTIVKLQTALNQVSLNFIRQKAHIEQLSGVVNGFWSQQQRIAQQLMNGGRATPVNAIHNVGF